MKMTQAEKTTELKILRIAWRFLCYLPWTWLIMLAIFTLGVTLREGHFPYLLNPDPANGTGALLRLIYLAFHGLGTPLLFASIVIWPLLGGLLKWSKLYQFRRQEIIAYLSGISISLWILLGNVAGLTDWLMD